MPIRKSDELAESRGYRERLLSAVLWTTAAGFGFASPWIILRERPPALAVIVLVSAMLAVLIVALVRSLPIWIRLGVLLACLYATGAVTIMLRGYSPNAFMVLGFMVVLVTLLSGRLAGLITVAVDALTILALSLLQHRGELVRDPNWQRYSDSALVPTIVRVSTLFVFVMLAFVVAISYVVERSEDLALQKARALEALQREEAEKARILADLLARDASLEALNQTLEQRVLDRTSQLVEANDSLSKAMQTRLRMEIELHQAQKLESVGRLAAGVAHEINTPVQFVSDSVHFIRGAMRDLAQLVGQYQQLEVAVAAGNAVREQARELADARERADLEYLLEHVPRALDRSLEGLDRVANIVRSMKEFAHPDEQEMTTVDLNRAIESTLIVARGEYKLVAEVETSLGPIPLVNCYAGDINQTLVNILINAAHAIEDVVRGTEQKGLIRIESTRDADAVAISIRDTGGGIPEEIRARIFDPFFTTKEVGRGTGQGLALARAVVNKHGGLLTFETEMGVGTTFTIRLPIAGNSAGG